MSYFLFFDLDHTLWDYDTNAAETLAELYEEFELYQYFSSLKAFINTFHHVNNHLWDQYNHGRIEREYMKLERFRLILKGRQSLSDDESLAMTHFFVTYCPKKAHLMPGALEILEILSPFYEMAIITNGFDDIQETKLSHSGLRKYFKNIYTSENTKARKPDTKIFDLALKTEQLNKNIQPVMIGDNLSTDIKGAFQAGWQSVWYNPQRKNEQHTANHEIYELHELTQIFKTR